jgi:5-methylcytosine-specific restriction endonuclease McrA
MMLAEYCARCHRRHDPAFGCWTGKRRRDAIAATLGVQGRVCWICSGVATTADHIVPRSKGGDDAPSNLRPACLSCNARRGNDDNPFEPDAEMTPSGLGLSDRWRQ